MRRRYWRVDWADVSISEQGVAVPKSGVKSQRYGIEGNRRENRRSGRCIASPAAVGRITAG